MRCMWWGGLVLSGYLYAGLAAFCARFNVSFTYAARPREVRIAEPVLYISTQTVLKKAVPKITIRDERSGEIPKW